MMTTDVYILSKQLTFMWIGFVGAISFMEAWLKFRAPGITLQLGLGIGRIVFKALNRVEWVLFLLITGFVTYQHGFTLSENLLFLYVAGLILLIQTIVLLPQLDKRAEKHIQGEKVPSSYLHLYYVILEICKTGCLFFFGLNN